MSRRTSEASKAIRLAWQKEQELVLEGKGTRDWTPEQQQDILDKDKGKAYDENGKAFEGHHMKSAEKYPEYQGEPDNIQFLTRPEHLAAHDGFFQNFTNGYYNPITGETKDFGLNMYEPCEVIKLSNPVSIINRQIPSSDANAEKTTSYDVNMSNERRVSDIIKDTDSNTSKQSFYSKQPINSKRDGGFKRFIDEAKKLIGKAVNYAINNPGKVITGIVAVAGVVEEVVSVTKNYDSGTSKSNNSDYIPPIDADRDNHYEESDFAADEFFGNDTISDDSAEMSERLSPCEHTVKPHGQHYGKDKVWKEKKAYKRGGKNKDN